MSGIFGIFNRNNQPVDKKQLQAMQDAVSYWNPDELGEWTKGFIALGHAMLWNTPESKYEHLPLSKELYVLTMDARIDNREELAKELDLPNRPMDEIGDSEFILAAYEKWGEACPKYLLGDFAFVIWDKKKHHLFCARDPFGIKLFHYYLDDKRFIFASDIIGILAHPAVPHNYNEKIISIFLRDNGVNILEETFFEKIKKLPGGKSLIITESKIREQTYWQIENSPSIRYGSYQEYVDALRSLLESAVEVRLRTNYDVVSHLSGGIDSSPIAVLAARKLKGRQQSLHAYNWINIPQDSEDYEMHAYEFSRRIARIENINHCEFDIDPVFMADQYDSHNIMTKGTMAYFREYYIQNEAKKIGARSILSGWGGDEFISNNGYTYITKLFKTGHIIKATKALYEERKIKKYSWYQFIKRCIYEMRIPLFHQYWESQKKIDLYESDDYRYVVQNFREVMGKFPCQTLPDVFGVRNQQKMLFYYGHIQNRIESWGLSSFSKRVEYTYPLLDRRIVEFALGIPEEIFFTRNTHQRHLMRAAIIDLLPEDIVWFPKADESRVNKTFKKYYKASLEKWYQKYRNDFIRMGNNPYIDFEKIISSLKEYDFNQSDPDILGKIVVAILVANAMKNDG